MDKPRIITIIQARMASSRLPGKILEDLAGKTMLAWVVDRARRAELVDEVVVATTTDPSDDPVVEFCQAQGYPVSRGSMHDVLDRYFQAASLYQADIIVRLTADCPLIDPGMIDDNLQTFLAADPPLDFAANRLPGDRSVPIGLDTEICTMAALEFAWNNAGEDHCREHVMPYFYEHPDQFNILHIRHQPDYGSYRWTVDTPEDLEVVRKIIAHFEGRDDFSWLEVLALVQSRPEIMDANAGVRHKDYREVDDRK
ncbi:MAG: glycosyltransferase family protein [Anaerolineae bacterium]|nr:glycosyltransferase family protein [Anaerolineae bacterium]